VFAVPEHRGPDGPQGGKINAPGGDHNRFCGVGGVAGGRVARSPRTPPGDSLTRQYNRRFLEIARGRKIPVIDLYGEFLTRAPGDAWKSGLLHEDGVHFTHEWSGGPPTESNLARCGYLLRCWLLVQKLKEIKARVSDQMK
jgi:hypothetical protein